MAELVIDLIKLKHNLHEVHQICTEKGLEIIGIVKGCFAHLSIVRIFQESGIRTLGMVGIADTANILPILNNRPMMITLPLPRDAKNVVRYFKASLNSETETIQALSYASAQCCIPHDIILMVDNGDLREGVMPEDVLKIVRQILEMPGKYLRFRGLGSNLGCCSGTLPDAENMTLLQTLAIDIEKYLGHPVETISVGGSVVLDWLEHHELPSKINQIRIGEVILLGYNTSVNKRHRDFFDDVFTLKAHIIEIKEKPSLPPGIQGCDAFGRIPRFEDRGIRKRAILDFGLADTEPTGLTPRVKGIDVLNSNSNYTITDVTDCRQPLKVGDILEFSINYSAMMRLFLSPYIPKTVLKIDD